MRRPVPQTEAPVLGAANFERDHNCGGKLFVSKSKITYTVKRTLSLLRYLLPVVCYPLNREMRHTDILHTQWTKTALEVDRRKPAPQRPR